MRHVKRFGLLFVIVLVVCAWGSLGGTSRDGWDNYCGGDYEGRPNTCVYWDDAVQQSSWLPDLGILGWSVVFTLMLFPAVTLFLDDVNKGVGNNGTQTQS